MSFLLVYPPKKENTDLLYFPIQIQPMLNIIHYVALRVRKFKF